MSREVRHARTTEDQCLNRRSATIYVVFDNIPRLSSNQFDLTWRYQDALAAGGPVLRLCIREPKKENDYLSLTWIPNPGAACSSHAVGIDLPASRKIVGPFSFNHSCTECVAIDADGELVSWGRRMAR
jgi:hypothetical protein